MLHFGAAFPALPLLASLHSIPYLSHLLLFTFYLARSLPQGGEQET